MTTSMRWSEPTIEQTPTPTIKNHSVTYYDNYLYCFGGYDGRRNHMTLMIYSVHDQKWTLGRSSGNPPPGRNGHTATLANNERIIIIGGWLGSGPLAADDTHVLDISEGPTGLRWIEPTVRGTPPGPCNMHSADYIPHAEEVYVFRGGNGREYLNDLHALHVETYTWRRVPTTGAAPQQRANHSSAVLEKELFIFGGWNGKERLNDIHILDTVNGVWTAPIVNGVLPHPRAGMTLTALRDRLYLFGGSGTSSKCFHDLQILDRKEMTWLDVTPLKEEIPQSNSSQHASPYPEDMPPTSPSTATYQKHSNWQSQDHHHHDVAYSPQNANPNDIDSIQTITILGAGPGRRAGHTATAVNRRIYIFGGSCGSDYLNDFFVLDTDPPPKANISHSNSLQLLERRLKHFYNDEEFSDVTFLVEGKKVYGHRMVLSLVSDCFRAMFTNGFRESNVTEIEIPHCSHQAFVTMMEYIYTGQTPHILLEGDNMPGGVAKVVELLELADQFFLDHLKQVCERMLQPMVRMDTYEFMLSVAQKTNAKQLENVCRHFERNMDHIEEDALTEQRQRQQPTIGHIGLW